MHYLKISPRNQGEEFDSAKLLMTNKKMPCSCEQGIFINLALIRTVSELTEQPEKPKTES